MSKQEQDSTEKNIEVLAKNIKVLAEDVTEVKELVNQKGTNLKNINDGADHNTLIFWTLMTICGLVILGIIVSQYA